MWLQAGQNHLATEDPEEHVETVLDVSTFISTTGCDGTFATEDRTGACPA